MNPKIQTLEKLGFEVQCLQLRRLEGSEAFSTRYNIRASKKKPAAKGGLTVLSVREPSGKVHFSYAQCCKADNFDHARGFQISLDRILRQLAKDNKIPQNLCD